MNDDAVVDQVNEASKPDVPVLAEPLPNVVDLLRGLYVEETDTWHTRAKVREMTGGDEEFLAELGAKDSITFTEYTNGVLERAVVSIGELPATLDIVNKLILPDRDMLFLAIMKATYGVEREVSVVCPHCEERQGVVLELEEDFPILGTDKDLRSPVDVKLKNGTVSFRLPNGEITADSVKNSDSTAELNTRIIAQCVITKEKTPLEERIEWARDLSIPDRRKVDKALTEALQDVGPQLGEVETRCAKCDEPMPLLMDWVSLLLG